MKNYKLIGAIAVLVVLTSILTVQVVMSTPSGKNAGWYRKEFATFRPQFQTVNIGAAVSANASIYCPGIKSADQLFMCIEVDSIGDASGRTILTNLTDSTYYQADDTIRCGTAITASSDLIVGWQKSNY